MPNFSSLARLEGPEKFLWGGGVVLTKSAILSSYTTKNLLVLLRESISSKRQELNILIFDRDTAILSSILSPIFFSKMPSS